MLTSFREMWLTCDIDLLYCLFTYWKVCNDVRKVIIMNDSVIAVVLPGWLGLQIHRLGITILTTWSTSRRMASRRWRGSTLALARMSWWTSWMRRREHKWMTWLDCLVQVQFLLKVLVRLWMLGGLPSAWSWWDKIAWLAAVCVGQLLNILSARNFVSVSTISCHSWQVHGWRALVSVNGQIYMVAPSTNACDQGKYFYFMPGHLAVAISELSRYWQCQALK